MAIKLQGFSGEIPKAEPFYLPQTAAAFSMNASIKRGSLGPIRQASTEDHLFAADMTSIYLHVGQWLGWDHPVDVVPGPVAHDRLYLTHSNAPPSFIHEDTERLLSLPNPTTKATATLSGALDPELAEEVYYAFTWVTTLGEESGPSPLSNPLMWSPGRNVNLTGLPTVAPVANRLITSKRIYRSTTSTGGATDLFYVGETTVAASSWLHNPTTNPMVEAINVKEFDPAPDNLRGLTALPNGMMAGFAGRNLYFCEPYQPHAWPNAYSLAVNDLIIGLAAFGTTLAVLTTGTPYVVQGLHPDQMVMQKMEQPFPCLAKRSIVDMGYSAIYASTDGLVQVSEGGAQLISQHLWTRDQWQEMRPTTIIGGRMGQNYAFTFTPADETSRITVVVDMSGEQPTVLRNNHQPREIYTDVPSGRTYFLAANRRTVRTFEAPSAAKASFTWRSKPWRLDKPESFGAVRIETDGLEEAGDTLACRIYADGALIHTIRNPNSNERLPAGSYRNWQIELAGTMNVLRVAIGRTFAELND